MEEDRRHAGVKPLEIFPGGAVGDPQAPENVPIQAVFGIGPHAHPPGYSTGWATRRS
jgi:hypothetical protein